LTDPIRRGGQNSINPKSEFPNPKSDISNPGEVSCSSVLRSN